MAKEIFTYHNYNILKLIHKLQKTNVGQHEIFQIENGDGQEPKDNL